MSVSPQRSVCTNSAGQIEFDALLSSLNHDFENWLKRSRTRPKGPRNTDAASNRTRPLRRVRISCFDAVVEAGHGGRPSAVVFQGPRDPLSRK